MDLSLLGAVASRLLQDMQGARDGARDGASDGAGSAAASSLLASLVQDFGSAVLR